MVKTNAKKIYDLVKAEAVVTAKSDLRQYLTGFSSSFGFVVTDKCGTTFYTDSRYLEGAANFLNGTDIKVKEFVGSIEDLIKPYKEIAIPVDSTLYRDYENYKTLGVKIVDSSAAFTEAMSIKEDYEIDCIKKACSITDKAFMDLLGEIKEGMSENDVAATLEFLMRKYGASGTSFETIVGFEENSSVPHHETSLRKLKYGDIVLIDFGCKFGGYCSDCTRTFLFGDDRRHEEFKKSYAAVLDAHMRVKERLRSGMTGQEADAIARNCLDEYGLAEYFTHSLGHGIGINIHEFPRLSVKSQAILKDNMIFSDEPGVYLEGKYGIRIEDTVMLKCGKVISLTDSDKKLTVI